MKQVTRRNPSEEEAAELLDLKLKAIQLLKNNNVELTSADWPDNVKKLRLFIDDYKNGAVTFETLQADKVDTAYGIGEIYAEAVMAQYGWEYDFLTFEEDEFRGFAVISPGNKYCIMVHHYLYDLLNNTEKENTALLLFNMLEGPLPAEKNNSYVTLS